MAKLYYVGFNGYNQCPGTNNLLKVITKWTSIFVDDLQSVCCTFRSLIVETKKTFYLYGLACNAKLDKVVIDKPCRVDTFNMCDNYLLVSEGLTLWMNTYNNAVKWVKLDVTLCKQEEEEIWSEDGNRIVKISFRLDTSDAFLLTSNGCVWILKDQKSLELLFPHDLDKAIDLASGLEHSLILTESGCVLSFGNGSRGQLGNGNLNSTNLPVQIEQLEGLKVRKIAAGAWHSCAITDSGDLCCWGWNNFGQLSAFEEETQVGLSATPIFVDVGENPDIEVVDVVCGSRHTVAKLANGDLFASGWNCYGQLGLESTEENVSKFNKCSLQQNQRRQLLCGAWYTVVLDYEPTASS